MKVLISDKIDDSALGLLKDQKIDFDYNPEITPSDLISTISQYDGLVVRSRTKVIKEVIEKSQLKVIGRVGSGVDNIELPVCQAKKITVVNAPDANSQAVAEHAIGLIISLLRNYKKAFSSMMDGLWLKKELTGFELSGKKVGILGYGNIGKRIEKIVTSFGATPIIYSRRYQTVSLAELFREADILTIHLSLSPDTRNFVTEELLELMKPTAIFINTSRGEIVDEDALLKILENKKIRGAALDVFSKEPLPFDSPFRKLENCLLTPHIGASTKEALKKASMSVVYDIIAVLRGEKAKNQIYEK